jgi:CelD/BcsL family acetyltransferase involved in cellulose biosynthesis
MPSATSLRYEWITDASGFLAVRDQWNLLGSSAIETIFLTHAWLQSWLEQMAPDAQLHVLTAWDAERLVAALPLVGRPEVSGGRRWSIMGTGTLTPNHLDLIAEPEFAEEALREFVRMLLQESDHWDAVEFDKMPRDTATAAALQSAFGDAGFATHSEVSAIAPYCELPSTYAEYLASRKKRVRKKMRHTVREFGEKPNATLKVAETEAEALEGLAELIRLHQSRWTGKGYPGAFADRRVVRFHESIVRAAFAEGWLRMYTLHDGDEPVAVSYDFRVHGVVQAYLSSFDERWWGWSPGVLVRAYIVEHSIEEGAKRFDFLEGTESYKADWCNCVRENLRVSVFSHTLSGRLAHVRLASRTTSIRLARRWVPQGLRDRAVKALAARGTKQLPSDDTDL